MHPRSRLFSPRSRRLLNWTASGLLGLGAFPALAPAQESIDVPAQKQPAPTAAGTVTLEDCLHLAMTKQPALTAAQASLAAAQSGRQALDNLPCYAGLLSRDLPVRKRQACLGVTIASAGMQQTEWEARYAVRRTYYSYAYVLSQLLVAENALTKLKEAKPLAEKLSNLGPGGGNKENRVTKEDVKAIEINIGLLEVKIGEVEAQRENARDALREAIGVGPDFPLEPLAEGLPALVVALNKDELVAAALHNRPEIAQANAASDVAHLEVDAQGRIHHRLQAKTFAAGADIHAKQIPQGVSNGEYRPGALLPEMPPFLVGRRPDRMQRAGDLSGRAGAVVEKTNNLVALEVEVQYNKWLDSRQRILRLTPLLGKSRSFAETIWTRFNEGNATGEEFIRANTLENQVLAQRNEAYYLQALALAALERATAGALQVPAELTQDVKTHKPAE